MKKLARNTLALGTATLIVTAGLSFSANGAEVKTYTSYAEAQYIASTGQLLGSALVDPLGDALENSGARSSAPATVAGKTGEQHVSGPLDPLKTLTVPVGTALDAKVGAAGSYANTRNDFAAAAAGAVTNRGLVDVGSSSAPPSNATLNLTGPNSGLKSLSGLAGLQLDTGALGSSVSQESASAAAKSSYQLAGGTLTLTVPALTTLNTALGGVTGSSGTLATQLAPDLTLNAASICTLLLGLPSTLLPGVTLPGSQALCEQAAAANAIGSVTISGVDTLTTGLKDVTDDGIAFDFAKGSITIDIAKAFKSLDADHRDINSLPANTDILAVILPGVVRNLDDLVAAVKTDLVDQLTSKLKVEGTLLTVPLPALSLQQARDAGLGTVVDTLFAGLDTALEPVSDALGDTLDPLLKQIQPLIKLTVNVPDEYRKLIASRLATTGVTAAASRTTSAVTSETALRVQLLTAPGAATALDILLGNSLVGPNSVTVTDSGAAADDSDAPADNGDSASDSDSDSDSGSGSGGGSSNGGSSDTVSDSDAQADADVTTTLPSTGAPNLLPFWLLGIALLMFGGAVLVNEKRRLNATN